MGYGSIIFPRETFFNFTGAIIEAEIQASDNYPIFFTFGISMIWPIQSLKQSGRLGHLNCFGL